MDEKGIKLEPKKDQVKKAENKTPEAADVKAENKKREVAVDVRTEKNQDKASRNPKAIQKGVVNMDFDHVVFTSHVDELHKIKKLTEEEKKVFSYLKWEEYCTTLVVVDDWFTDVDTVTYLDHIHATRRENRKGKIMVVRRTGDKTATYGYRSARYNMESRRNRKKTKDTDVIPLVDTKTPDEQHYFMRRKNLYVCYQYASRKLSDTQLLAQLKSDIHIGYPKARLVKVVRQCRWKYSPKLSCQAIKDGAVWKMRDMQGKNNMWYTGSSWSHESVDNVVDFNHDLKYHMELVLRNAENWSPCRRAWAAFWHKYGEIFSMDNK